MSLLTPTEAHAFQKFLSSLDTTDFSAAWNMQLEVSHEHMPPAHGREALAQATKDLMSLDTDKWRYPLPHTPSPRESPSEQPVTRHPQPQSNALSFLYSTRRERRVQSGDAAPPRSQPPTRSRTHIPPLQRTVDPSSVSTRTRARTFAFGNTSSSSSSSQSPIDPSSSVSSFSTHNTTPAPVSSNKRSPPADHTASNKRRRQSSVASQQVASASDAGRASTLLSPSQKKANHIQSEQKRRANIRRGYEALCDIVPSLREAMLAEAMEEEAAAAANGKKGGGGRRRCKGKAANDDNDKVDGRSGPKSEHVVLSKTIDYVTELLSEHDVFKQRLMVARSALPLDHPLLQRHPDAPPPLWERKWSGGDAKDGDEDDDEES
ncbi:hypothetical protein CY34DRAFT_811228 [Suillus luteus UH-Slu-Lm8-n1]|uniref:BHLH domain-containing protein n=1 Tax=Suillus luteus UH-Slu-Lm8-n1 TaxID=930992 RepID=A0A0D0AEL1_9AGAM|nr:hypothetical protein CY34DRAFT_811228 [Suillus luteus UH-Slu-Lm8-n1]